MNPTLEAIVAAASPLVNVVGVGIFVIAILRDKLMTFGQHMRRMGDAEKAHAAAIAELSNHYVTLAGVQDRSYVELKESRDYYRAARLEERVRADRVTDQLAEIVEYIKLTNHMLASFPAPEEAQP